MQMTQHNDNAGYGDRAHVTDGTGCWCNPEVVVVKGEPIKALDEPEPEPQVEPKGGGSPYPFDDQSFSIGSGPADHPREIEVNVVFGAQLRAIVRSALRHVQNKISAASNIEDESQVVAANIVREEMGKWSVSTHADEPEDTLPQWLYNRFAFGRRGARGWHDMEPEDRLFWEHEADAVRRAVGRGGFRDPKDARRTDPEPLVLHTPISDLEEAHTRADGTVKSVRPLDLKNTDSFGQAIRYAVGAASTCWTNLGAAGVFKSEEALDISVQLEHHVEARIQEGLGAIGRRHNVAGAFLRSNLEQHKSMVSAREVLDILIGRSTTPGYDGPEGTEWRNVGTNGRIDNPYNDGGV